MYDRPGSVADLVRLGQLKSDRRGMYDSDTPVHFASELVVSSRPLKYADPFSNPLVKLGKKNSTVELCRKVYQLAPVTLTKEENVIHMRRGYGAYQ